MDYYVTHLQRYYSKQLNEEETIYNTILSHRGRTQKYK